MGVNSGYLLCHVLRVQNLCVGAPCGVMDQMTAALGEAGQLTALLCQPAELQAGVHIPPQVSTGNNRMGGPACRRVGFWSVQARKASARSLPVLAGAATLVSL